MSDPALRHGGPDAGWYVPVDHGWRRISDGEVSDHGDAAHFMSDPNGLRKVTVTDIPAGTIVCDEDGNEIGRTLPGEQLIKISHGQKPPAS